MIVVVDFVMDDCTGWIDVNGESLCGCEFEGKLCFQGTVRINGAFRGEIYTPDTLVIGENARVTANGE